MTEMFLFIIVVCLLFIWAEISSAVKKLDEISTYLSKILSKFYFHFPKEYVISLSESDKKDLNIVVANFYKFLIENVLRNKND